MNAFKKISAIVISLAMIMSCAFSTVAFAETEFTDVESSNQYVTAITDLASKGIINGYANEDGTYRFAPEGEITRAEFAKIIAVASVPNGYVFGAATPSFTDVPADNWAVPYIEYAVNAKIINGMGDGTFAPNAPVTYGQAIKMIVCALNYGAIIVPGDPWYQPYIELANRLNVTTNAFGAAEANATRGLVAQLIYNMNRTKPAVQTGTDAEGKPIYSSSDSSYESETKNTSKISGQLIAVFETTLSGSSERLRKDEIKILTGSDDEEILTAGKFEMSELEQFLGYDVDITYSEDSSGEYVIETIKKSSSNKTYVIKDIDISDVTETELEYFDEDSKSGVSKLKINDDMSVLRNGGAIDMDELVDELYIDSGEITFIDIDGNRVMDVAFIKSYDTYFVSSVTKSNGVYTVYDKFDSGRKLILDEDIDDITVKLVNNGSDELKDGSLNSISSSSVLSVAVSAGDSNRKEIIVSKKTASGSSATSEVKSISSGNFTIKFGTKSVDSSNYYLANNSLETQQLSVGDTCTAYLDFTGKLVAVNKKATTTNYGYITKVGTRSSSMDDSEYLVRMYDTSGRLHSELPVATKGFKINGSSADPEDLIEAVEASALLLNENKDESKIENAEQATLVKYELSNGQLKSVYLVDEDEDNAIVPKHISEGESALTYRSSSNSFRSGSNTKFTISSTTKVIVVPLDRTASNYRITSGTGYFTDGLTYMIDAFDAGAGSLAKVVVVYGVNTTIKATAETYLVKSVDEELNDKNEEIHTLSYYKLGSSELLTIQGADEDTFDGVESGDVIRVLKNGDVVDKVQRLFSAEDKELISEDIINDGGNYDENIEGGLYQNTAGSTYTAVYGTVISKFGEMADGSNKETIEVSASGDEEDAISFKTSSSTAVVRYVGDESNNNNTVFEFDKNEYDIMDINPDPDDASKVLVIRYNSGAIKGIIIYE